MIKLRLNSFYPGSIIFGSSVKQMKHIIKSTQTHFRFFDLEQTHTLKIITEARGNQRVYESFLVELVLV